MNSSPDHLTLEYIVNVLDPDDKRTVNLKY